MYEILIREYIKKCTEDVKVVDYDTMQTKRDADLEENYEQEQRKLIYGRNIVSLFKKTLF